jgi:hypothetical protein
MKRFHAAARGKSTRIIKPFSRMRIVVRERTKWRRKHMGQKSNPIGLRLQINRTWDSRWFAEGADYGRLLLEDLKIRKFIMKTLPQAAISKVVIERPAKLCRVSIYAARPGVIIGKKGADIEKLRRSSAMTKRRQPQHRRNPQAGSRREARCPGHRRSAGTPYRVPSRDEARRAVGAASGCRRHQDHLRWPSWRC